MKLNKLEIESALFKRNVFQLEDISKGKEFNLREKAIVKEYNPFYIQCIIEALNIQLIHSLEDNGFRFIEFRVIKTLSTHNYSHVGANVFYPFQLHLITDKIHLERTEQLLFDGYADDRFSKDPHIKNNISKARLMGYLHKSYSNQPKEFLYALMNVSTNEMVAFKTGEFINKNEVQFYLSGGIGIQENSKYLNMLEILLIGTLMDKGVKWIRSITSGLNLSEMNLSQHGLNYRIDATKIILRKLY